MSIDLIKNWDPYKYAGLSLQKDWDLTTFNLNFDKNKMSYQDAIQEQDEKVLNKLNEISNQPIAPKEAMLAASLQPKDDSITKLSFKNILIEWKMAFMNVINDILHLQLSKNTIYQKNFLFYLGLTIVIFVIFFYILYSIYILLSSDNKQQKITYEHIHKYYFK